MARGEIGKESPLFNVGETQITGVGKGSLMIGGSFGMNDNVSSAASADGRITGEIGVGASNNKGDVTFNSALSGGIVVDPVHTCDGLNLTAGAKLNASTGLGYTPNENLRLNAGVSGYSVFTPTSKDYGFQGGVSAQYTPNSGGPSIFGSVGVGQENQNIHIGLFNQMTENNTTITAQVGANINPNTSIRLGYTHHSDALNHTRNYSQIEAGVKFNF